MTNFYDLENQDDDFAEDYSEEQISEEKLDKQRKAQAIAKKRRLEELLAERRLRKELDDFDKDLGLSSTSNLYEDDDL